MLSNKKITQFCFVLSTLFFITFRREIKYDDGWCCHEKKRGGDERHKYFPVGDMK